MTTDEAPKTDKDRKRPKMTKEAPTNTRNEVRNTLLKEVTLYISCAFNFLKKLYVGPQHWISMTLFSVEKPFHFSQRCYRLFQRCVHPPPPPSLVQLVWQCFALSANHQDPYYSLLGPPPSQFCELLAQQVKVVTKLDTPKSDYRERTGTEW